MMGPALGDGEGAVEGTEEGVEAVVVSAMVVLRNERKRIEENVNAKFA